MKYCTPTNEEWRLIRSTLRNTTTFSKRGLANKTGLSFALIDYAVDSLVSKNEVQALGYGLFKKVFPMTKYEFKKIYGRGFY